MSPITEISFPTFLLLTSIALSAIIAPSTSSSMEKKAEIIDSFTSIDETAIEQLFLKDRAKSDLSQDELEQLENAKMWYLDQAKLVQQYKDNPDQEGLYKKMTGLDNLDEIINPTAHSASESLEFMVDYLGNSMKFEEDLDQILLSLHDADNTQGHFLTIFRTFIQNMEPIIAEAKEGIERIETRELKASQIFTVFREIYHKADKFRTEFQTFMDTSVKDEDKSLRRMAENREILLDKYQKLRDMHTSLFTRHVYMLQNSVGLDIVDADNVGDDEAAMSGQKINFDLTILETLLTDYQSLEGAKNQLLSAQDPVDVAKLGVKIIELEKKIENDKENSQEEYQKLMPFVHSFTVRTQKKLWTSDVKVMKMMEKKNPVWAEVVNVKAKFAELMNKAKVGMERDEL